MVRPYDSAMMTLVAALALAAGDVPVCSLAHVEQCADITELVVRKDFKRELRHFLGRGRASWIFPAEDKTEQVLALLNVSQDAPARLADGTISLNGCMAHNCPERANIFFAPSGEIRAVALLYHACAVKACTGEEDYTLRILVRERSAVLEAYAKDWAKADLRVMAKAFPWLDERIGETAVEVVKG
jgi:hypothetical protein